MVDVTPKPRQITPNALTTPAPRGGVGSWGPADAPAPPSVPGDTRQALLNYIEETKQPSPSRAGDWGPEKVPTKPGRQPRRDLFEAPEQEIVGKRPPGPEPGDRRDRRQINRTANVNEWRDRINVASWRGVPFELETYVLPVGRKSFVHEFAQSDGIFVEDNGRETRYHRLRGFVIGDDYDLQRDALIRALEVVGPGDLMHPYFGLRRCYVVPPSSVTENTRENRIAMFEMTFVDVDEGTFPREVTDFPAAVATKLILLTTVSKEAADTSESLLKASRPLVYFTYFQQFQSAMTDRTLTFLGLALEGTSFKDEFASLLLTITDVKLLVQCLSQWVKIPPTTFSEEDTALRTFSTWVRTEIESRCAVLVSTTDYASYDAAVREASSVLEQIQIDEIETNDPATYENLVDIRIFMMQAVYNLAAILPRERDLEVQGVVPALVLAYNLYETPLRDQEIIARNSIQHPSFASGTLKVLTR